MKQTLLEIKRRTSLTTQAIAERASLPIADVYSVEVGGIVSNGNVERVLSAFNQLSGMRVSPDDIKYSVSSINLNSSSKKGGRSERIHSTRR